MIKLFRNTEYGNMVKGIFILVLITFLVMGGLYPTAYLMGAGDTAYSISVYFVVAQGFCITLLYCHWYKKTNNLAKDMFNNSEMRKAAGSYAIRHLLLSIGITLGIAAIALLVTFLNLIFVGISQIYSFTSVISEGVIGNLTLGLLLWHFGLPNRVLGRY